MLRTNSLAMLLCAVVAPLFIGCEPSQTIPTEAPVYNRQNDLYNFVKRNVQKSKIFVSV